MKVSLTLEPPHPQAFTSDQPVRGAATLRIKHSETILQVTVSLRGNLHSHTKIASMTSNIVCTGQLDADLLSTTMRRTEDEIPIYSDSVKVILPRIMFYQSLQEVSSSSKYRNRFSLQQVRHGTNEALLSQKEHIPFPSNSGSLPLLHVVSINLELHVWQMLYPRASVSRHQNTMALRRCDTGCV